MFVQTFSPIVDLNFISSPFRIIAHFCAPNFTRKMFKWLASEQAISRESGSSSHDLRPLHPLTNIFFTNSMPLHRRIIKPKYCTY
jgi:hypothetical protein